MAFRQQQRPRSARHISYNAPEPQAEVAASSQQLKRPLHQSEEWILFSPAAPSTTARTHTTSTERTPRTAGLSRFSEFGSLDTAAQSGQDDDAGTFLGTEEELDSLDDGLHAFHEPSEYGAPPGRLLQSGETVLPTHDGLGEFEPDATMQEHMWQFERPRRRVARRRSSVQRHFSVLDEVDGLSHEQERRQRIEKWRLEQSKALLEEIEKETRRRRRMSMVSATTPTASRAAPSVVDAQSDSSDESPENLSFWQLITRRVIRDLIGLDEDTLSVIFGESLPEEASTPKPASPADFSAEKAFQEAGFDLSTLEHDWQTRLLERVARELGTLVDQLSEHPGAFSSYQRTQSVPEHASLTTVKSNTTTTTKASSSQQLATQSTTIPSSAHFAPTFPAHQTSHTYSEASLWGIEEEPAEIDPLNAFRSPPAPTANVAEDLAREREYWERQLDVKMIFSFLVKRFTSRPAPPRRGSSTPNPTPTADDDDDDDLSSARRAAIIRQHHPLVKRTTTSSSSAQLPTSSARDTNKRKDMSMYRSNHHYNASRVAAKKGLRSNSSCASQSTKKSKRSAGSARNYWDFGGSGGSGSLMAGEV